MKFGGSKKKLLGERGCRGIFNSSICSCFYEFVYICFTNQYNDSIFEIMSCANIVWGRMNVRAVRVGVAAGRGAALGERTARIHASGRKGREEALVIVEGGGSAVTEDAFGN